MDTFFQRLIDQLGNLPQDLLILGLGIGVAVLVIGLIAGYFLNRVVGQRQTRRRIEKAQLDAQEASMRSQSERLQALYNLTSALSATLNYEHVLDKALDLSVHALSTPGEASEQLFSAVMLFEQDQLQVVSSRRFTRSDTLLTFSGTSGLIGHTINQGLPQASEDISNDPELQRIIALRSCRSAYCFPLRAGIDTYGVLFFAHPEPSFFTPDRGEILDILGNQANIAIQNALLYDDLEQEKERMVEIQEEARKKLARDLHDGPTQSIAAIAMRLNFARRLMERDSKTASQEFQKIEDLARRTTKEIRHMLFTLRPLVLESQGLKAALDSMAEKMRETYSQNVIIKVNPQASTQMELGKQGVVFYIAEEAVNNARKHAQAEHIWVRVKATKGDFALLEVEDDGVGFNIGEIDASYERRGSLGMVNMRERAELINGVLEIDSSEGKGTRIRVWIPLTEEAADRIRYAT